MGIIKETPKVSLKSVDGHPDLRIIEVESEGMVEKLWVNLEELNALKNLLKIKPACGPNCKCEKQ